MHANSYAVPRATAEIDAAAMDVATAKERARQKAKGLSIRACLRLGARE